MKAIQPTAQPPMIWRCTIPLVPMGKQRPRFGKGRTYTPAETLKWTRSAAAYMKRAWTYAPYSKTALSVEVVAYFPRTKSRPPYVPSDVWRSGRAFWKITKPDADNITKIVLDSMTEAGVIEDDNIIAVETTHKVICSKQKDDVPRVEVTVRLMDWEVAK